MYTLKQILNDPDVTGTWHGSNGESVTYHEVGDYWSWDIDSQRGSSDAFEAVRAAVSHLLDAPAARFTLLDWINTNHDEICGWPSTGRSVGICWVRDCDRSPHVYGLCRTHYFRAYRGWKRAIKPGANVPGDNPRETGR